jgi:putative Mg2+ transporter-C (MgtC) family protein
MCLSIQLAAQGRAAGGGGDPTRLAAQVVSGIGFLGAGAIIRFGANIKGLTTATSLWTVAIVGLTVGAGCYVAALYATVMLMFTLTVMDKWEKRVIVHTSTRALSIRAADRPGLVDDVRAGLASLDVELKAFSFNKNIQTSEITLKILAKIRDKANEQKLIECISAIPGCKDIGME